MEQKNGKEGKKMTKNDVNERKKEHSEKETKNEKTKNERMK